VDALLDAKPSRAEPWFATHRLWTEFLCRPESEGSMVFTMVILLGVVMITCLIGAAVIPRFDRRLPAAVAKEPRASARRSA